MIVFEEILAKHHDHTVSIIAKEFKNRTVAVPGLHCNNCHKLIKWLNYKEAQDLLELGVDTAIDPDLRQQWLNLA